MSKQKIAVLGAGSWGTALANHLLSKNNDLLLWSIEEDVVEEINTKHTNSKYFPDGKLNPSLKATTDLKQAASGASFVVMVVPSSAVRSVCKELTSIISDETVIVSTAKGLEKSTNLSMSEVIESELGKKACVLTGPSFAKEVLAGLPTAVTLSSKDSSQLDKTANIFHHGNFRIYTHDDVIGAEFGGVFKNVIAIAAGIVDAKQIGANARAALITRSLSEMTKVIVALGGKAETAAGLSGLGDLLLTTTGDLSRNRQVGLALGRGESLDEVVKNLGQVAEGVYTAEKLLELAKKHNLELPITEEVASILNGQKSVDEALSSLLSRKRTAE